MNSKFIKSKLKQLILVKKRRIRGYPVNSYGARCEFNNQIRKFYANQDIKIIQEALQKAIERRKENQSDDSNNR